jgi:hypothetical protein
MSNPPAYLETWLVNGPGIVTDDSEWLFEGIASDVPPDPERLMLAAAAPALVRALLAVEWGHETDRFAKTCPECAGRVYRDDWSEPRHDACCPLNAALAAAGFPDQASRDVARERIQKMRSASGANRTPR